jgi:hypothetical protein
MKYDVAPQPQGQDCNGAPAPAVAVVVFVVGDSVAVVVFAVAQLLGALVDLGILVGLYWQRPTGDDA